MSLRIDGVELDNFARWQGVESAPFAVPGVRGENPYVPSRHGVLYVPGKPYEAPVQTYQIWIKGVEEDGSVPPDKFVEVTKNIDNALRMFTKRYSPLHIELDMPDGSVRECFGEVTSSFDLKRVSRALPWANFAVNIQILNGFWQDGDDITYSSPTALLDNSALLLEPFVGGNAPIDDSVLVVHGPADNPMLTVLESGAYTRYEGNLAVGEDWRLDSSSWLSVTGTGIGFAGTGTSNVIGQTFHRGSARLLDIPPVSDGVPTLRFNGDNLGAATQVEIRGRRKFFVA